jgi:5-methylcytosine-specific restriction protein A
MARNPTWSRDELILALDLYLRHRERLPDNDATEIVELSQTLNSLFGEQAKDAALFRNRNGVYMKLANFRAVDPLHTSQGTWPFEGRQRSRGALGGILEP